MRAGRTASASDLRRRRGHRQEYLSPALAAAETDDRLLAYRLPSGEVDQVPKPTDAALLRRIGARLRERREALGRSQADVAEAAGVHVTYMSGLERGLRNPSILVLRAVCEVLEVSLDELLG